MTLFKWLKGLFFGMESTKEKIPENTQTKKSNNGKEHCKCGNTIIEKNKRTKKLYTKCVLCRAKMKKGGKAKNGRH